MAPSSPLFVLFFLLRNLFGACRLKRLGCPTSNGGLATKALGEESGHARWHIVEERGDAWLLSGTWLRLYRARRAFTARLCERFVGTPACEACFAPECEVMWKTGGQWELKRKLLFPRVSVLRDRRRRRVERRAAQDSRDGPPAGVVVRGCGVRCCVLGRHRQRHGGARLA